MSPTNKETADLIRRIKGAESIPPQALMPNGGTRGSVLSNIKPYDPSVLAKQTQEGEDLAAQIAKGGMNIVGAGFRALTGLGRGVTNLAAGAVPHVNAIWDSYKDGFQVEDIPNRAKETLALLADGAWGAIKGIAVSGAGGAAEKLIKTVDQRPIYEYGQDFFNSEDYKKYMANLGVDWQPETKIGDLDLSGVGLGKYPITQGSAIGLGWDIFTDPTTYATLGVAGAARGAGRGTSTVIKYRKAGKPANFAEVLPKALPRPFYSAVKGGKDIPLANPTYTVANTSPLTYIVKEMGRGFVESHRSRAAHIASKAIARRAVQDYNAGIVKGILDQEGKATDQYIEELAGLNKDQVLYNQRLLLEKQNIADPEEQARILAETEAAINAQAKEIAARAAEFRETLGSSEAVANIRRLAEENGITPIEEGMFELADRTARGFKRTKPAIARQKVERWNSQTAADFGRALDSISNPNNVDVNFGAAWNSFLEASANDSKTVTKVFEALVKPIGYRERWAEAAKRTLEEQLTENRELAQELYSIKTPLAKGNRKPVADMVAKEEQVMGTKKTRKVYSQKKSKELQELMKIIAGKRNERRGAGSRTTAPAKSPITEAELIQAPNDFLLNLVKNYYEDVVRATKPDTKPWDELTTKTKAVWTEEVLNDPSVITSEVFNKSMISPTLMAARVQYLAEREVSRPTKEYSRILQWKEKGYNPATFRAAHPKLHMLAFSEEEIGQLKTLTLAEGIRLMMAASGRLLDPEVNKVLRKLKVRVDDLYLGGELVNMPKVEAMLHDAHIAVVAKKRDDYLLKLRTENTGELGAEALVDPAQLDAKTEALLGQHIEDLQAKGTLATQEEIEDAIQRLGSIQDSQIAAIDRLNSLGFDMLGQGNPAYLAMSTLQWPKRAKARNTEEKTFAEIQSIIAAPKQKVEGPVAPKELFGEIIGKLEELAARPTTSAMIKKGIDEILTGKIGIKKLEVVPLDSKTVAAYFSRIGNIIRQMEDRLSIGSVAGFDTVFSRAGGEYDQQAFFPFIELAYRASKSQDSLDGGYFANHIDAILLKKDANAKRLSEQTVEEIKQSLKLLGTWRGEGISAGLLHTIIRFTEKQNVRKYKGKLTPVSDAMKADMARAENNLYDEMIQAFVELDKKKYEVAFERTSTVTEDPGYGNMARVVLDQLSPAEREVHAEIVKQKMLTIDANLNVIEMLQKLANAISDAKSIGEFKLTKPKVFRDGKFIDVANLTDMKPGDQISYAQFEKLSFALDKELSSIDNAKASDLNAWQTAGDTFRDAKKAYKEKKISKKQYDLAAKKFEQIDTKFRKKFGGDGDRTIKLNAIRQQAKQLSQRGLANAEKKAAAQIERSRALSEISKIYPRFARKDIMEKAAEKIGDPIKAAINWRARAWLGTLIHEGDKGIRALEIQDRNLMELQAKLKKNPKALKEEQEEFGKIVGNLKRAYSKEGYAETTEDLSNMSILEVIAMDNPQQFLRKVLQMKVVTAKEREDWAIAMEHMLNLTVTGNGQRFNNFSELVKSYREGVKSQVEPPTDRELLEILTQFGGGVGEKALAYAANPTVDRRTVLSLLKKLDKEISKNDIQAAKDNDFISATHVAGEEQVRAIVGTLPEPKVMKQELQNQLTLELLKLHDEGLGWIALVAARSLGASNNQFFLKRLEELKITEVDSLGRTIDVDAPAYTAKRKAQKQSYESGQTLLTGWTEMVNILSQMAAKQGLKDYSDPRRIKFMTENAMRVLRLRDLYLGSRGIFPVTTPQITRKENKILNMGVYTPEEVIGVSKPVYLTDGDVLDIFPPEMIGRLMFVGPEKSLPVTSFLPAARLLVSAFDTIKPGTYFDEAQLRALGNKMAELMRNDTQYSRTSKKGEISHYNINPEEVDYSIRTVVSYMLQESNAHKLFEQHAINASVATQIFKYESGQVTAPIIKAVTKMFENPFASTGNKIEAMLKASEAIRSLTGTEEITEQVLLQAELDLNVVMAAYLKLDDFHIAQEALKMEAAAKSPEAQAILKAQRASAKSGGNYEMQRYNQIRLELDRSRGEAFINVAGLRNLNEVQKPPQVGKDDPFDVFMDHETSGVVMSRALRFGESFGRLFYNYGMEDLRPLYAPVESRRVDAVTTFEVIGANMNKKWQKAFPNRNILGEAWRIIQQVPDEILDAAFEARKRLYIAAEEVAQTGKKRLGADEYAELVKESNLLDKYLTLNDKDLNRAAIELWALAGRLFAGGEKSMVKINGIVPKWINRNLKEIGGGSRFGYIDEAGNYTPVKNSYGFTSKESMATIWREWEITNPVEMITTMNTALERAFIVPKIADDAVRLFGVSKTKYANAAAAKADGLVEIKTVTDISKGKELVHFMDTENHYFPIEIAQQLGEFSKFVSEIKHLQDKGVAEKLLSKFSSFTDVAKQLLTIWRPANYIQNWMGGIWTDFFAGVNSPFAYARGKKLLSVSGRTIKDVGDNELDTALAKYEAMKGQEGLVIKSVNDPRKTDTILITINGKARPFSYSDLEKLANRNGLYVPVAQSREYDLVGEVGSAKTVGQAVTKLRKIKRVYDKPTYWLGQKAAERDDWLRATLFLDEISKHNWKSLDEAARTAMVKVNRYHPQVQGLSTFNQKWTRQFVMFFTWRAKMTSTVIGDLFERPGRMLNVVRTQQALMNTNEETYSNTFGDMTPTSTALPGFYKHNLDPIAIDPTTGMMTRFSLANPTTDLLGSASWLSQIDFNTYEPIHDQFLSAGIDTLKQFTWQSAPFILKEAVNLPQNKLSTGTIFGQNGYSAWKDSPAIVNDVMQGFGLGPIHTMAAAMFGGVFLNSKMANLNDQQRWAEAMRSIGNWASGIKATPLDTIDNRKKGWQELVDKIKTVKELP